MDMPANFSDLWSSDRELQNRAYADVLAATRDAVDWAYAVWDQVLANLTHKDNHNRAIAAQVLSSLAKSDPEQRILRDFEALFAVTGDDRFVTARHCMQSLWQVGVVGKPQQEMLIAALERRFHDCISEKNCTLIRYDVLESLRKVYNAVPVESIMAKALALIETEANVKYRKKYATLWKLK